MDSVKPTYEELVKKLAKADEIILALKRQRASQATYEKNTASTNARDLKEAYTESEQNFRNSMDACALGIRVITADGELIYMNTAIVEICGYQTAAELQAVPKAQLYTPESYAGHMERREKRKRGESVPSEYRISIKRPDGAIRTLQVFRKEITWGGQRQFMAMYEDITARLAAEKALKNREEFLDNLINNTPSPLWVSDETGTVIRLNQALRDMLQIKDEEIIGKYNVLKDTQVIEQGFLPLVKSVYKEGKTVSFSLEYETGRETQVNLASATHTVLDIVLSAVKNDEGKVTHVICQEKDITERKKAEQALKESQEMFSRAFKNSPILMLITTQKEGRIVEVNDVLCQATGYNREELVGHTTPGLKLWETPGPKKEIIDSIKEKGMASNVEMKMRIKSGEMRLINMSVAEITLKNEPCFITIAEDITDRKKIEEELIIQRDFNHSMFQTAPMVMLVLESDGRILTFNPYVEEISGYKLEEVKGKYYWDIFPAESERAATKEYFYQIITGAPVKGDIAKILTKEGAEREIEWSENVLKGTSGKGNVMLIVGQDVTEHRNMEASLRYHASLVQNVSDAIISSDAEYKILTWNKAAEEMYGWREEEVMGKTVMEVTKSVLVNVTQQEILEILRRDGHWRGESIHQRRNGENFNVLVSVSMMRDGQGKELGAVTIFKDVTDQKKAEQAIHESEERFRRIFQSGPLGIVLTGMDFNFKMANARFCEMFGYTEDEILKMTFKNLSFKDDIGNNLANLEKMVNGELKEYHTEKRYKKKDGGTFWGDLTVTLLQDSAGRPQRFLSMIRDITLRKQAEERISHLNLTLRSIRNINQLITREKDRERLIQGVCESLVVSGSFENAWIVLLDDAHRPVTWSSSNNNNFSRVKLFAKDKELPRCAQKALKQNRVVVIDSPYEQCKGCPAIENRQDIGSMAIRLEIEGRIYGVLCTSMPRGLLTDEDEKSLFNEVAGDISFALRDIELGANNEMLQQERLRSAKLESIGTLAGGIAHDFNNLLTGIMGNIGMAKSYLTPSSDIYEMLDEAEKAAIRSRNLTQQLLTFARGGKPIKKLVKLNDIIKESATFALRGSNVKMILSLPDDLWQVEADEGQISQVIHNLVINADEAMPDGGTLHIGAKNLPVAGVGALPLPHVNYVQIDVSDTGVGIAPEHLQRIFEPYFTTKHQGSGLGLTSVYSIVKNHGGTLLAESVLNEGSVFHIYLPASKKLTKGVKKVAAAQSTQAGGKILVMDDDDTIRKMLKNMLNLAGYEVELSKDGVEALAKYKDAMDNRDPFNAVIMDLTIPGGMGGKEAIKNLLEIDPQAAVIVSSGYATDPIMSEYNKYGFSAVIAKPYSIKQLQDTIAGLNTKKKK